MLIWTRNIGSVYPTDIEIGMFFAIYSIGFGIKSWNRKPVRKFPISGFSTYLI